SVPAPDCMGRKPRQTPEPAFSVTRAGHKTCDKYCDIPHNQPSQNYNSFSHEQVKAGARGKAKTFQHYILRRIQTASLASFDSACQLFSASHLHQYKFPSFVEHFFDMLRYIDHPTGWDDFVVSMNVSVIHLLKPET